MKKLIVLVLILGIGSMTSNLSAQENRDTKTQDAKKGGFAVGGFDASRKETKDVKRSVNMNEEAEVSEKSMEEMPPMPAEEQMAAPAPPPAANKAIESKRPEGFKGKAYKSGKQKPKKNQKPKDK